MSEARPNPSIIDSPPLLDREDKGLSKGDEMKVAVIGAGPSGLVTLKYLTTAHHYFPIEPIEVICFEAESEIGGTFKYRVYEDAELVSSKYLTAFSDHRFSSELPDFVTPEDMCDYLEGYAAKYDLYKYICFDTDVVNVKRRDRGHVVTMQPRFGVKKEIWFDAIAICSGLHVYPDRPHIPGLLQGVKHMFHSSEFKTREQFGENTNVVILGAGETAMDLAYLAVTSPTKSVTLCHRDGFLCGPKKIPTPRILNGWIANPGPDTYNKPTDCAVASLFDTAYVPEVIQKSQMMWDFYDKWVKFSQYMISGTPAGPDQWVGLIPKGRNHVDSLFFCKSGRALPYMSANHRSKSWWNRVRSFFINVPIPDTGGRVIDVKPWPCGVLLDGTMCFGKELPSNWANPEIPRIKADVVVLATGYQRSAPYLDQSYCPPMQATNRDVYPLGQVDVGYVGFVRPGFGAIPPLAEMQAQFWVLRLLQTKFPDKMPPIVPEGGKSTYASALDPYELDYALHRRDKNHVFYATKGGVEHEAYAYQLALDMGAAPTFKHVFSKGFKVFYTWAMGSNFNPKFRLVGPWADSEEAEHVMKTELYGIVKKTGGLFFFFTYTLVPMFIFGTMCVILRVAGWLCRLFGLKPRSVARFFRCPGSLTYEELHND